MSEDTVILKLGPVVLGRGQGQRDPPEKTHETVSGLVLDAVAEMCQKSTTPIVTVHGCPTLAAKSMVSVLTYCYTKGVLCATDIEQSLWKDDVLRGSCSEQIPTAKTISRFRRLNRGLIQTCLENALRRIRRALVSSTLSQSLTCGEAETKPKPARLLAAAPAPGEGTTIFVHKEAAQRVENATCLDRELVSE